MISHLHLFGDSTVSLKIVVSNQTLRPFKRLMQQSVIGPLCNQTVVILSRMTIME